MHAMDAHIKVSPLLRRPAVVRLLLITLLAEMGYGVLNVSNMPVYLLERGYGQSVVGLVFTAFLLSEAVFKGTMGHLADRFGRRRMMVIGPAITAFTPLVTLAIPYEWGYGGTFSLIMLRICDGIGAAMLWPAAYALIGDLVEEGEKQQGLSLLNMCFMMGIALALPIGGAVNDSLGGLFGDHGGHQIPSFYLSTLLFASAAILAFFFVPSGKDHRNKLDAIERETGNGGEASEFRGFLDSIHRIPKYLLLGFITFMGIGFPIAQFKPFAIQQFQMSESGFGLVILPGAILMGVLSVPLGKLGERIGKIRAVHVGMTLCVLGLAMIASGAVLPFARTGWMLALGGIPVGLGFLLTIPAWYASVSEIDPSHRAANIGAVMTAQGLGAIIGTPLGAACYEHLQRFGPDFGRYSPFLGCLACIALGWAIGLRILREPR